MHKRQGLKKVELSASKKLKYQSDNKNIFPFVLATVYSLWPFLCSPASVVLK